MVQLVNLIHQEFAYGATFQVLHQSNQRKMLVKLSFDNRQL